jgi:hypothetical protein
VFYVNVLNNIYIPSREHKLFALFGRRPGTKNLQIFYSSPKTLLSWQLTYVPSPEMDLGVYSKVSLTFHHRLITSLLFFYVILHVSVDCRYIPAELMAKRLRLAILKTRFTILTVVSINCRE